MPQQECVCEGQNKVFGDYGKEAMGRTGGMGDAPGPRAAEPQFLPQPGDDIVKAPEGEMGPIGPWASGRVDWGPLAGLTGTRPVVDSYSITRYSEGEWRKHNHDVLCGASEDQRRANVVELNSREAMENIAAAADKKQHDNTLRLGQRAHEVLRWKTELERALEDMTTEIDLLEEQRRRARQAKTALGIVKNIAKECLGRRAKRMEPDLVRDETEEELVKEAALVKEIEDLIDRTLIQIEEQQERNKAIKARMEDDWSDKKQTHEIASNNINLTIKSPKILFKPGATRFPESQSTPAGWEDNVRDVLQTAQEVKGQSCELRALLDGPIFSDCVHDLRAQADRVDQALARRVRETDLCRQALENELAVVVRRIAETEKLIGELKAAIRAMDAPMKKAQTRLDNRMHRPRIENCRDKPQFGLVEEVKTLAEQVSCLQGRLKEAEEALVRLYTARGQLEREIQIKRNCVNSACRLVEEVKTLAEQVSCLQGRLKEAEEALVRLYTARGQLEREIQIKRNCVNSACRLVEEVKTLAEQVSCLQGRLKEAEEALVRLYTARGQLEREIQIKRNCVNSACRLVEEVKTLAEQVSCLQGRLKEAEEALVRLYTARGQLEREIQIKRNCVNSACRLVEEVKTLAEQVSCLQGRLKEAEEALVRLYTARGQLEREIQIKRNCVNSACRLVEEVKTLAEQVSCLQGRLKEAEEALVRLYTARGQLEREIQIKRNCVNSACRLVEEVKTLAEQVSCLQGRLKEAEEALVRLYTARGQLEREIQIKRNSLYIDKERCQVTRSHYPSSSALAGHA